MYTCESEGLQKMKNTIHSLLARLGIEQTQKCYDCLYRAIEMTAEDFSLVGSVTKLLYAELAKEYCSTPAHMERIIRHLIEKSWEQGDEVLFELLFGYHRGTGNVRPTNSEYIAVLADEARR